ncbi:MAG: hypothetical protein R3C01_03675 [Planctomycetaceae bacterium]
MKDQPACLVAPKKSLKTNISVDIAISLATGGRFLGVLPGGHLLQGGQGARQPGTRRVPTGPF